ncbi:MAG: hypothetical protein BWY59_01293 [Verrucomicrobia bacterium ADurb.Bin345]|nr:MAG: hypothetical protein BWY59_01293 [Verrucomicrobia bacterium ADurb.Bin345]
MTRPGIKCPQCGNVNDLGRVFCSKCGSRLDLSKVSTRILARGMQKPHDSMYRLLRNLLLLALIAALCLLLWPAGLVGDTGTVKEARQFAAKIAAIQRAQQAGLYVFEVATEREVNAYIAEILKQNKNISQSEGMRMGIEAITVRVEPLPKGLTVVILANWGPVRLSYEVTGVPVVKQGLFYLDVQSARWGHLPLPGPAGQWVSQRVANVFSQMRRERKMLDQLGRFDVGDGRIRLVTKRT